MTSSDLALFWLGIGLIFGLIGSNSLWKMKIRDKAASGLRLEVGGDLYEVKRADNG